MAMGVAGLAFRGRAEHGGDIVVAFDIGLLCEIEIASVSLAFAGKGVFQIVLGLGTLESSHFSLPSFRKWVAHPGAAVRLLRLCAVTAATSSGPKKIRRKKIVCPVPKPVNRLERF